MDFFIILLFCLAMSLDCIMVGISYGISGISLPVSSMAVVAAISGLVLLASMSLGGILAGIIPIGMLAIISSSVLAIIGIWRICSVKKSRHTKKKNTPVLLSFKIPLFHVAVQVSRTPEAADANKDGTVDASDAFVLGIAMALDSLSAGLGAALVGFSPISTSVTAAACCFLCILISLKAGARFRLTLVGSQHKYITKDTAAYVSGIILILLAIWRLI